MQKACSQKRLSFTKEELAKVLYGPESSAYGHQIKRSCDQVVNSSANGLQLVKIDSPGDFGYGVFCGPRPIKKGMRFGPYTGSIVSLDEANSSHTQRDFLWEIFAEGKLRYFVNGDTSRRNWMKFVRCARYPAEQNLVLIQQNLSLYYEASREIAQGEELRVWYGDGYSLFMGLPLGIKKTHEDSSSFPCQYCGKVFAYKYYLERHFKYTSCIDSGNRKFPCALCTRSFDKKDRLRVHILHVHEKHRPHQCEECGKRFTQSSSLNKHTRVHSGEKPYKCPHCAKMFTASSILRTHMRQHSGEKPFKCRHCWRAFASHAAHDSHVRRNHFERFIS